MCNMCKGFLCLKSGYFCFYTLVCTFDFMEAENKEKLPDQFRLKFEQEDVQFMNYYKQEYGASIQWFVEKAVKLRIQELKVKLDLGEI